MQGIMVMTSKRVQEKMMIMMKMTRNKKRTPIMTKISQSTVRANHKTVKMRNQRTPTKPPKRPRSPRAKR